MTASGNDHFDQTVTRDFTVSRQMLDSLRGVLPACHVCGNPSGYKDFEGRWSHQICSGESSKEKRDAKFAARGGKIAPDAGQSDLSDLAVIMRKAEESAAKNLAERRAEARPVKGSAARKALVAKSPAERMAERAEVMAHIRATQPRPARRAPEVISRMNERDVYDLSRIRTDPTNPDALRGELIDRARRANDLAHYPTAGRDQERVQDHIDDLLRRSDSEQWNGAEVARRILATGSKAYRRGFVKIIVSQIRMNSGPILTLEETQALKIVNEIRAMGQATGTVGGFAVPYTLDGTITATSAGSRNPFRQICRVETISGSNEWRQATSGAMTAAYAAEVAVSSDNSPTLSQPTLRVVRAQAFAPVSLELAEDWGLINDQLGSLVQQAKDDLEAVKFAVGTGTGEPEGVTVGGTAVSTTAAFDLANDLYPVETALPARFRPNAVWLANRAQYQLIRQFVQPESSAPIIDHVPGGPSEVIGYTAYEASGMWNAALRSSL